MAVYGYARVSTRGQATEGNSLEAQIKELKDNGASEVYCDTYTGTTTDRPEFNKLIEKLKSENNSTLMVTKLDRFARSVSQGSELIEELNEAGVKVHILNMKQIIDNTPTGKLMWQIFLSFAEFERNMIVERTTEGKRIARQRPDFTEGRPPKFDTEQIDNALALLKNHSYTQVTKLTGISKSTLIRAKTKAKAKAIQEKE